MVPLHLAPRRQLQHLLAPDEPTAGPGRAHARAGLGPGYRVQPGREAGVAVFEAVGYGLRLAAGGSDRAIEIAGFRFRLPRPHRFPAAPFPRRAFSWSQAATLRPFLAELS